MALEWSTLTDFFEERGYKLQKNVIPEIQMHMPMGEYDVFIGDGALKMDKDSDVATAVGGTYFLKFNVESHKAVVFVTKEVSEELVVVTLTQFEEERKVEF